MKRDFTDEFIKYIKREEKGTPKPESNKRPYEIRLGRSQDTQRY